MFSEETACVCVWWCTLNIRTQSAPSPMLANRDWMLLIGSATWYSADHPIRPMLANRDWMLLIGSAAWYSAHPIHPMLGRQPVPAHSDSGVRTLLSTTSVKSFWECGCCALQVVDGITYAINLYAEIAKRGKSARQQLWLDVVSSPGGRLWLVRAEPAKKGRGPTPAIWYQPLRQSTCLSAALPFAALPCAGCSCA